MKILVVGASGLVGSHLLKAAAARGHQAVGTYATHPAPGLIELSLGDTTAVAHVFETHQPDAVICCSAWSWVDGCQKDPARAFRENAELPSQLARMAHHHRARFLYFSSSYVFDGKVAAYDEQAVTNPLSVYGESKLRGEQLSRQETDGQALIVRTMGVYGEEPQQKNFVYQVVRQLRAGKPMTIPSDQSGNATYAGDLASMSLCLLEKKAQGIWNVAGPEAELCRKDFALHIAAEYGLDASLFRFVTTAQLGQTAPRPLGGGLIVDRAVQATGLRPSAWKSIDIPENQ